MTNRIIPNENERHMLLYLGKRIQYNAEQERNYRAKGDAEAETYYRGCKHSYTTAARAAYSYFRTK